MKKLMVFLNLVVNIFYGRNISITTANGSYSLLTTFGHPLKRYLTRFKKYDRFLPFLSKALAKSVIDIGANIGDTLVLIKSLSNVEVICVEPDENFIKFLRQNIESNRFDKVKIYPYPISSMQKLVTIEKNALKSTSNVSVLKNGTAQKAITTKTFKDLVEDLSLDVNAIGIIKSDTDGYDWDCLNSFADYFDSLETSIHYPEFIFYEHQTYLNNLGWRDSGTKEREHCYENALRRLMQHGYTEFYVFDNFGTLIRHTNKVDEVLSIANQLLKKRHPIKVSNYFVDVLVTRFATNHIVEEALQLQSMEGMLIN